MRMFVKLAAAVAVITGLSIGVGSVPDAGATVHNPALNPIPNPTPNLPVWTATPNTWIDSWLSDEANVDIGSQNVANVQSVLETSTWIGQPLTFVGGGSCGNGGVVCGPAEGSGSIGLGGLVADVYGIHFDNMFLVLLYPSGISNFAIEGLWAGVSNIYAFNVIPLPAGFLLFLSGLAGIGFLGRYKAKRSAPAEA